MTGTWRVPPPGRFWVNGYWKRDDQGWYRVPGFWSERKTDRLDYRKNGPPQERPDEEPGQPPVDDCFFIPGQYYPDGDGVVWKKGFWAKVQPGWSWVPAQWVRQPEGWVFQDGYWDRTLEDRGTLFAPAEVNKAAQPSDNLTYQPYTTVSPELYGQLNGAFGRPNTNYDGYPGVFYDERRPVTTAMPTTATSAPITAISIIRPAADTDIPTMPLPCSTVGATAAMVAVTAAMAAATAGMAYGGYGGYGGYDGRRIRARAWLSVLRGLRIRRPAVLRRASPMAGLRSTAGWASAGSGFGGLGFGGFWLRRVRPRARVRLSRLRVWLRVRLRRSSGWASRSMGVLITAVLERGSHGRGFGRRTIRSATAM